MGINSIKITNAELADIANNEPDEKTIENMRKRSGYIKPQETFQMTGKLDNGTEFSGTGQYNKGSIAVKEISMDGKRYKVEPEFTASINDKREMTDNNQKELLGKLLERKTITTGVAFFKTTTKLIEIAEPKKTSALSNDEAMKLAMEQADKPSSGFEPKHNALPSTPNRSKGTAIG